MIGSRYLFSNPKYEAGYVFETWLVGRTCFLTHNMKLRIYLRPSWLRVHYYLPKTWDVIYTNHQYLFSHLKYEVQHIPTTNNCFPTQNIKLCKYLQHSRFIQILFSLFWLRKLERWATSQVGYMYIFLFFCLQKFKRKGKYASSSFFIKYIFNVDYYVMHSLTW